MRRINEDAIFFSGALNNHLSNSEIEKNLKEKYEDVVVLSSVISGEKLIDNRDQVLVAEVLQKLQNDRKITIYTHSFGLQEFHSFYKLLLAESANQNLKNKVLSNVELVMISPYGLGNGFKDLWIHFKRIVRLAYTQSPLGKMSKDLLYPHHEHGITSLSFLPPQNIDLDLLSETLTKFLPGYFGHNDTKGMKSALGFEKNKGIHQNIDTDLLKEIYEKVFYIDIIINRIVNSLNTNTLDPKITEAKIYLLKLQLKKRAAILAKEMDDAFTGNNPDFFKRKVDIDVEKTESTYQFLHQIWTALKNFYFENRDGEVLTDLVNWKLHGLKLSIKILEHDVIVSMDELKEQLKMNDDEFLEFVVFVKSATHASFVLNPDNVL